MTVWQKSAWWLKFSGDTYTMIWHGMKIRVSTQQTSLVIICVHFNRMWEVQILHILVVWQATIQLPSAADLSNCHLDYLPENLFVNSDLEVLNLRSNCLCDQPAVELVSHTGWLNSLTRYVTVTVADVYHLWWVLGIQMLDLWISEVSCVDLFFLNLLILAYCR